MKKWFMRLSGFAVLSACTSFFLSCLLKHTRAILMNFDINFNNGMNLNYSIKITPTTALSNNQAEERHTWKFD